MSAYFITACGTGLGKTFVTCALIHAARMAGREVRAYKPVISGFDAADADSDTVRIMGALAVPLANSPLGGRESTTSWGASVGGNFNASNRGEPPPPKRKGVLTPPQGGSGRVGHDLDSISPWRFAAPLSPNMAAAREGRSIDFNTLVSWSRAQIPPLSPPSTGGLTLIEGIGGAMVPITSTHTVRDWMAALGIPVILVTGSYLGSISHSLTAIEALRATNIPIRALIISETADSTVPLVETLQTILPFTDDIPLRIAQTRVSSPADATEIHALLEQL